MEDEPRIAAWNAKVEWLLTGRQWRSSPAAELRASAPPFTAVVKARAGGPLRVEPCAGRDRSGARCTAAGCSAARRRPSRPCVYRCAGRCCRCSIVRCSLCSSGTPTDSPPHRGSAGRWRGRSAARGWCSTTRWPRAGPRTRPGAPYPGDAALSKALTAAKRTPQRAWLAEVSAVVLQQALADANTAYRNFFASLKGTRKGRRLGAPRFRSKRDRRQSIRFTKAARFRVLPNGRLRLPGVGDVPVRWSRELPSEPSSVTVTVDAAGRYHCSFVVEVPDQPSPPVGTEVGIDLGLTHFAVLSDGRKIDAPRFARKAQAKLRRAQKELARRQRGSVNREKSRRKVARAHARVGDTRRDWLHKLSTSIVQENQLVTVEDLAVSGLARTRLARSVHDAGWSMFVGMLAYKAQRAGRTLVTVDRWFPSTRACSVCGAIGDAKPLHVRTWTCGCGTTHDRDVNAARNILAAGRAERPTPVETTSASGLPERLSVKQEPAGSAA